MTVNYLNLTNGLDFVGEVKNYKLVRIQSTICEAKNYDKLIKDLDYNFLFDLAQGYTVRIYDTSSKKRMTRALYQGLAFIEYVLRKRWFNEEPRAKVKQFDVTTYFEQEYRKLSIDAKHKIDYAKKFLNTSSIHIETYCRKTYHDGDYEYFRKVLAGEKPKNCEGQISW